MEAEETRGTMTEYNWRGTGTCCSDPNRSRREQSRGSSRVVSNSILRRMERWHGKVAVVTGASAGIGSSIAKELVKAGMKVVGLARRVDKVQQLASQLPKGQLLAVSCDVTKEEDIVKAFNFVEKEFGGLDVLINNAGFIHNEPILAGSPENFRKILDVNVVGVAVCAREAVRIMKKNKVNGHIININSIAGHFADSIHLPLSVYPASKYAVTAMTIGIRHELAAEKLPIKITSISPGAVRTDMIEKAGIPNEILNNMPILRDKDIADAVVYALGTPPNVQVLELMIAPLESAAKLDSSYWRDPSKK